MLISASITRDSSPPEATSRSGPGATPGFGPIRNSTASPPAGPSAPALVPGARAILDHDLERRLRHRQVAQLGAHRLRERPAALATPPPAGRAASSLEGGDVALQLLLQPRRRLPGIREPVAFGAAALGVLEHRFDRPAVLALQPRELLEALLDGREALRVGLDRPEVGAQLGSDVLQLVDDGLRTRRERAERLVAVAGAAQLARPRPPAAPSAPAESISLGSIASEAAEAA